MSDLIPFDYGDSRIRVVMREDEPWFVAADACTVLDIRDTYDATRYLDDDERQTIDVRTISPSTKRGNPTITIVSEPGLYSLILRSRRPEAKRFKRWITHEVIPQIRRTGNYGTTAKPELPQDYGSALRELANTWEREQRQARELADTRDHVATIEPAAHSWEKLVDTSGDYNLRDAAQVLDRDPAIDLGQNRLAKYLREIGWMDRRNTPYQRQVDCGRMVQRLGAYIPQKGQQATQPCITPKGLGELHRRLGGERPLRLDLR